MKDATHCPVEQEISIKEMDQDKAEYPHLKMELQNQLPLG